jgi:hypothetical protein
MLGKFRPFAFVLFIFVFAFVLAGCGKEAPPPRIDLVTQVSIECPECKDRFFRTLSEVREAIAKKDSKVYCKNGHEFILTKETCSRFGRIIEPIEVKYQIAQPDGTLRTPWTVDMGEGATFNMIAEYNLLNGARFDRLTNMDVAFDGTNAVPRGPYKQVDPLANQNIREPAKSPELPIPEQGPWFLEPTWPDKDGVVQGIADVSEELGSGCRMYRFDHNVDTYNKQIEASSDDNPDLKKILSPPCMKEVALYLMSAEKFWPTRPTNKFSLQGVTSQESVPRVANADRDAQLDDGGNPVRYKFHEDRETITYKDDGTKETFIVSLRGKYPTFGAVVKPDFWAPDYKEEEPYFKFWDHGPYTAEANSFTNGTEINVEESKLSCLAKLLIEHKDVDKAWDEKTAVPVIRSTDLLKWVQRRTDDLTSAEPFSLSSVQQILRDEFIKIETKRNLFFGDIPKEKAPAPEKK